MNYGEMTGQNHTWDSANARTPGGLCFNGGSAGHNFYYERATPLNEFYLRFAVRANGASNVNHLHISNYGGGTHLMTFRWANNQPIIPYLANTTALGASNVNVPTGTWHLIEMHLRIHRTAGVIEIKQNGVMSYLYRGPTTLGPSCCRVLWYINSGGAMYYDDVAINDVAGDEDNSWIGDGYIVRLSPNGNGSISGWAGSDNNQIDNYLLVDERPFNADTDYVYAFADGVMDLYALSDLSSLPHPIKRIWPVVTAKRIAPDRGNQLNLVLKQDGEEAESTVYIPLNYGVTSGAALKQNPITGQPWTQTELNALQLGVRILEDN
jgi:hypothetical protein